MPVSRPVRPFRQIWLVMRSVRRENLLIANQTRDVDVDVDSVPAQAERLFASFSNFY